VKRVVIQAPNNDKPDCNDASGDIGSFRYNTLSKSDSPTGINDLLNGFLGIQSAYSELFADIPAALRIAEALTSAPPQPED
jgi:hypothetical protein